MTTESDDTSSSGSSLDEDYVLETNPKPLNKKQSKKNANKEKSDQPSTSARKSETSYDSWLIPNSTNEGRDGNNRRIVNIDHSGEGIEDIKNLRFPEFIKKDNIRYENVKIFFNFSIYYIKLTMKEKLLFKIEIKIWRGQMKMDTIHLVFIFQMKNLKSNINLPIYDTLIGLFINLN